MRTRDKLRGERERRKSPHGDYLFGGTSDKSICYLSAVFFHSCLFLSEERRGTGGGGCDGDDDVWLICL